MIHERKGKGDFHHYWDNVRRQVLQPTLANPMALYEKCRPSLEHVAYITRRIDRDESGGKYAMEDMCQLSGRLTEDKYKGSHEQIAKIVKRFSSNPLFDLTRLYELALFAWLTGNGDIHLKNFSLFKDPARQILQKKKI